MLHKDDAGGAQAIALTDSFNTDWSSLALGPDGARQQLSSRIALEVCASESAKKP